MRRRMPALVAGVGAILIGLPYIRHAFGPTEAEVVTWGQISAWAGAGLVLLWAGFGRCGRPAARALLGCGLLFIALLQVPPILLWFLFHGTGISDGSPPSAFVAHWAYAIPHLLLLAISAVGIQRLLRAEPQR